MQWPVEQPAAPVVQSALSRKAVTVGVAVLVALGVQLVGLPAVCREHALRQLLALFA